MQATDPNSHHQNFVGTLMTKFGHGKPTRGTDAKKDGQEQLRLSNEVIKCEIQSFENATSLSLHSGEKEHIVSFGKETTSEFAQVDIYRDLILRHLIKDINGTCERLQLPTDIQSWTSEDADKWIREMCAQFQLVIPVSEHGRQRLTGPQLFALSVDEFLERFPNGGDTLHAQLQLWAIAAYESSYETNGEITSEAQIRPPPSSLLYPTTITSATNRHWNSQLQSQTSSEWRNLASACSTSTRTFDKQAMPFRRLGQNVSVSSTDFSDVCSSASSTTSSNGNPNDESCVTDDDQYCQQLKTYHPSHHQSGLNCAQQRQATSQQQQLADGYPSALGSQTNFFGTGQFGHALPYQHQQASTGINVFQGQQPAGAAHTLQHQVVVLEKTKATNIGSSGGNIHLWHFIRELLERPKEYGSCVRWVDRKEGTFKIESSHHLAKYWGMRKNRIQMNYDKLSRSLRQYYKKGIIQKPEKKQRLIYKFLPPYNQ